MNETPKEIDLICERTYRANNATERHKLNIELLQVKAKRMIDGRDKVGWEGTYTRARKTIENLEAQCAS